MYIMLTFGNGIHIRSIHMNDNYIGHSSCKYSYEAGAMSMNSPERPAQLH